MTNGTFGLNFWLALAGGVLAFGVSLVLGHAGLFLAAVIGVVVFVILLLVLGMAMPGAAASKADAAPAAAKPAEQPVSPSQGAAPAAPAPAAMTAAPAPAAMDKAPLSAPAMDEQAPKAETIEKAAASVDASATAANAAPANSAPANSVFANSVPVNSAPVNSTPAKAAPAKAGAAKTTKGAAKGDAAPAPGSVGTAPATLAAPRDGRADDLKVIEGIGPVLEKLVNSLGFYHYDQIANWTADEVAWVDSHMNTFRGRILRDKWQAQAKIILSEGIPAFLERAKTNNY